LETSGESCECQCRNTAKEIAGTQCVCKTDITCAGTGEVIDPDTCACGCPPATVRCGGNCVDECLPGFVLKNCARVWKRSLAQAFAQAAATNVSARVGPRLTPAVRAAGLASAAPSLQPMRKRSVTAALAALRAIAASR